MTINPINYATATDDELDRWLAENVWKNAPIYHVHVGISNWINIKWQPTRDRDQADLCLSKFWDRWIVFFYRYGEEDYRGYAFSKETRDAHPETFAIEFAPEFYTDKCDLDSRARAELAAAIAMWEAEKSITP